MKLGPAPGPHFFATRLLPIVLCAGGALYFGNVAYLSLSVAFIQILKVGPTSIAAGSAACRVTSPLLCTCPAHAAEGGA